MPGSGGAGRGAKVPGGRRGAVRAARVITLGVEEEFVLLDPSTGAVVLAGPDLVRILGGEPGIQQGLMRFQVETGTRVCTGLDEPRSRADPAAAARPAAASLGCRLVASGVAQYRTPGLAAVTGQPRYQELARRYGPVVAEPAPAAATCTSGSPPGRGRPGPGPAAALAGAAARRLRQLPDRRRPRYQMGQLAVAIQSRWPTAIPPAAWPDAAAYDTAVRRLIGHGAALDERSVYFWARLSPRYPTVEVRVADVCLEPAPRCCWRG